MLERLFGWVAAPAAGFSLEIRKNPWNPEKVVGIFHAGSSGEADAAFPKIYHYGKYSSIAFVKGKNIDKKIFPSERGIIMELREEPAVVDLSLLRKLSDVIETAAAKKIVYIGEYHDRFSNHAVQLQIIRALLAGDTAGVDGERFTLAPDTAIGLTQHLGVSPRWLDVNAAGAVWPALDRKALTRAFDGLASQAVTLGSCEVRIVGESAIADCAGSATWTPKVGGRSHRQARQWQFQLRNVDAGWQIVSATVR
jgi:hypothetical protein